MSKKISTKIFSAIMVTALAVSANVSGYMGGFDDDRAHVNLNVGSKMINPGDKLGNDVKDMKSQTQFGLDLDYKFDVLPFHVAVGYHASSSEKGISTLSLSELRLGARKYQDFDAFSIYYGGGLSSVTAKLEMDYPASGLTQAQSLAALQTDHFNTVNPAVVTELVGTIPSDVTNATNYDDLKSAVNAIAPDDTGADTAAEISTVEKNAAVTALNDATYQGLAGVDSYVAAINTSETASTLGFYGEVGGLYNVTEAIYVGANLTYTSATVEFEKFSPKKEKMDVGGAQIGLVVGYAF